MPERRPLLRDLIRTFFADYLRLVEPDSACQMWLEQATFPPTDPPAEDPGDGGGSHTVGLAAEVLSHSGERVTVLVQIEPEALTPPEVAQRIGRYLMGLDVRYGQPVLLSVLFLEGGRPGVRLESGVIGEACGIELVRIYYSTLALAESRAEHYLERPEPLAWALASLMRPTLRTLEEHRRACLERIARAPLGEELRGVLRQATETFLAAERG